MCSGTRFTRECPPNVFIHSNSLCELVSDICTNAIQPSSTLAAGGGCPDVAVAAAAADPAAAIALEVAEGLAPAPGLSRRFLVVKHLFSWFRSQSSQHAVFSDVYSQVCCSIIWILLLVYVGSGPTGSLRSHRFYHKTKRLAQARAL